jgi:hypothetical protein
MEAPVLPQAILDLFPAAVRPYALYILLGVVAIVGLIALSILLAILKFLFGRKKKVSTPNLEEDLTEYPDLKASTGDRQLRVEGVPVRLRLVVVAKAGTAADDIDLDELGDILEKIVPGLKTIYKADKPRVKQWPAQVSYQGFATHFHRNMLTGEKEGKESRWVLVAGRAKLGKNQIMLGLAMQSIKTNIIGNLTVDSHQWASTLRVRVRD